MYLLRIQFSITDIVVLQVMAIILGFVIHFALVNRRKFQNMVEESKRRSSLTGSGGKYSDDGLKPIVTEKKKELPKGISIPLPVFRTIKNLVPLKEKETVLPEGLHDLKQTIRNQQKVLDQLLHRVDKLDMQKEEATVKAMSVLEQKEAELQKAKHQLSAAQKVAGRVTEVYQEFDQLQQKMSDLEENANKANELAMELDDVQQAYAQLRKDFARKQERIQEVVEENEQLHQRLSDTEDKLTEANLQRQQLAKKVQLLESINTELQQMSDANKKLKNEIRRIAELESMLSMVSDERDLLLKKRLS
jgi:chromosome segregation ATPase